MQVNGRPVAAFDPEGLVFSAGVDSEMIKLYDLRSFDKVEILQQSQINFSQRMYHSYFMMSRCLVLVCFGLHGHFI